MVMDLITISIHPPHAGRDRHSDTMCHCIDGFQSTLPMRGGTGSEVGAILGLNISIHPPHAGRD